MRSFLALMMVVAACGDDGNNNPIADAPVFPDGADATIDPVTLTVTDGVTPRAGVKVYFQNADSSLVSAATTDVTGVASAVMVAGGYVTAIDAFVTPVTTGIAAPTRIQTFANIKPGDHLVLHSTPSPTTGVPVNFNFIMADEPSGNAVRYEAWVPQCQRSASVNGAGSGAPPGGIVDLDGCAATTDVAAIAFNGANEPFASILQTNVAVADGGSLDLSDLANTPWVNSELVGYDYKVCPASVASFNLQSFQVTQKGILFETDLSNTITGGAGNVLDVVRPKLAGTTQVDYTQFSGPVNSFYEVLEWGAPKADYAIANVGAILPHEYTAMPTFDVATNSFTWTTDAAGVTPNFVRTAMSGSRSKGTTRWFWEIVDNGAATSVKLPTLPAPDDVFNATGNDDFHQVELLTTGHHPGGYDAVRAGLLSINPFGTPLGLVIGATGQIAFEELSFGTPAKPHRPRNPFAVHKRATAR